MQPISLAAGLPSQSESKARASTIATRHWQASSDHERMEEAVAPSSACDVEVASKFGSEVVEALAKSATDSVATQGRDLT